MPNKNIALIAALILVVTVPAVRGACPYDHFLIGQDQGTLFLDTSLLYRHWNEDWGSNPDPYGQEYYEFNEMYDGGYIRVEPGLSQTDDPQYALSGTRGEDYNILLRRVYATPGIAFFDDTMRPALLADDDTFALSDLDNHHVHMRYYLPDGLDPTLPYTVSYRLEDDRGLYADSEIYTFNLGAAAENSTQGDTNGDHRVDTLDYSNFVAQFGGPPGAESADFNDDNSVDLEDFAILRSNFGFGVGSAPDVQAATAAPEPGSAAMLLLGFGAVAARIKRRGGTGSGLNS